MSIFTPALLPFLLLSPQAAAASPAAETTTTVVVKGQPKDVSKRIDRKVYRTDANLRSSTGTAADVLNDIPSVDVDQDGNVSLRGSGKVTVLIDGKPSSQVSGAAAGDGLSQIPAGEIDRIEVVTNPSAEFKADGSGGVINIIMKKTRKPGVATTARVNVGNDQRYNLGASASLTNGKLNLSASGSLRHDDRLRKIRDTRSNPDPLSGLVVNNRHDLVEHATRLIPSLKAGIGYDLTDRDRLGASLSWGERKGDRYFLQQDQTQDANGTLIKASDRYSQGKEWRLDLQQGVSYDRRLGRDGETLGVNVQRTIVREREDYAYRNTFSLPAKGDTHDTLHLGLDLVNTDISLDYILPLAGDHMLKLGYDFQRDDNRFDNSGTTRNESTGADVIDADITNAFRYYQAIHAAYATYQTQAGPVDVLAGLRLEDTRVRTHQITGGQTAQTGYFRAYPSLHLSYSLTNAQKVFASYSQRVSRPDPEDLNPFSDHQDTHTLRAGNPDLKPEETGSLEAGYSYDAKATSYSATAYWRNTRNSVSDITRVISEDVVLLTKTNVPHSRAGGVEVAASGKLTPALGYTLSSNIFYNEIDTTSFGGTGIRSNISANAKTSVDYKVSAADAWQISGNATGRRLTPQGYIQPAFVINAGYKHQLRDTLSLVATVSDLFNSQKFQRIVNTGPLHEHYSRQQVGRIVYVGLIYTGAAAKKSKTSFDYDQ